jgi:transaldolase/glucose-6-phosphate isomerase
MNPIQKAQGLGQAMWVDYISRGLISSGEFGRLIEMGISGVTSNPTIFEKAIVGSTDYDDTLKTLARGRKSTEEIYEALVLEDIRAAADRLRPIYDSTDGKDGYVSLEVSPLLAHDTDGTIEEGRRLFATLGRPNVMIKVPATAEGMAAIHLLIGKGVNVNATLIFSLDAYYQVREAYIGGLESWIRSGNDPEKVASVASFFLSRLDTAVDALLTERIRGGEKQLKALLGKTAVASARLAYRAFKDTFYADCFAAQVQRPLWASTGTKNPDYSDVMYVEPLIGPDTVNTMPPATINAFIDHGHARLSLERDVAEAEQTLASLEENGISMEQVTAKLLADGVRLFADSYKKLLASIEEKKDKID